MTFAVGIGRAFWRPLLKSDGSTARVYAYRQGLMELAVNTWQFLAVIESARYAANVFSFHAYDFCGVMDVNRRL